MSSNTNSISISGFSLINSSILGVNQWVPKLLTVVIVNFPVGLFFWSPKDVSTSFSLLITSCAVLKTYSPFSVSVNPLACLSNNWTFKSCSKAWICRLIADWLRFKLIDFDLLEKSILTVSLEELIETYPKILKGEISGRVIVDLNK